MNQGAVDYGFAITVASAFVGLLVTWAPVKLGDNVVRALLFVAALGAVVYVAWSTGTLDLQHNALVYLALAVGVPGAHVLYKAQGGNTSATSTPGSQNAPVAPSEGQQTASAVDVAAVVATAQNAATATLDALKATA